MSRLIRNLIVMSGIGVAFAGGPARADSTILVDGVSYRFKQVDRKVVVTPADLAGTLIRQSGQPAPDCQAFNSDMTRLGRLLSHCVAGPDYNDGLCGLAKDGIASARSPDFTADVQQSWRAAPSASAPVGTDHVANAVAAKLQIPASRVLVVSHPENGAQVSSVELISAPGSWTAKLSAAGLPAAQSSVDPSSGTVTTSGRDVSCDLLSHQASLGLAISSRIQLNTRHIFSAEQSWAIRNPLASAEPAAASSLIEKAALAGGRIATQIKASGVATDEAADDQVLDLFRLLYQPQDLSLVSFDSFESFKQSGFEQNVDVTARLIGNAE